MAYLGCWKDDADVRDLSVDMSSGLDVTITACVDLCYAASKSQEYISAIVTGNRLETIINP